MDWFRSHHGAPTDAKWVMIARRAGTVPGVVAATWWQLLDYASQHPERGSIEGFDAEEWAAFSGWEQETIEAVLRACREKGMIDEQNRIVNWQKRQPAQDNRPPAHIWRALRDEVFARDHYTCTYCGEYGGRLECDHVMPVARGGSHNVGNLTTCCLRCNRAKRDQLPQEWRA